MIFKKKKDQYIDFTNNAWKYNTLIGLKTKLILKKYMLSIQILITTVIKFYR